MPPSPAFLQDPSLKITTAEIISSNNNQSSREQSTAFRCLDNKLLNSQISITVPEEDDIVKEEKKEVEESSSMSGSAVQREEDTTSRGAASPTTAANGVAVGAEGGSKGKTYKKWDQLTPREQELRYNFRVWASSFVRLDPRYRIHRFFQGIAQRGELKLQEAVWQKKKRESLLADDPERKARELLASCFNMASVFTIWRPCSEDAIRKMMQGKGVGKGLDIKGKSAKFGRCSGYVPFLQIHNEEDKKKIDLLPRDARMRIFYTSEETRQLAVDTMEKVRDEMMETVDIDQDSMTILRWSFAENPLTGGGDKPKAVKVDERHGSDISMMGSRDSISMSMVRDRLRGRGSDSSNIINNNDSISTYPRQKSVSPTRNAIVSDTNDIRKLKRVQSLGLHRESSYGSTGMDGGPMASAGGGPSRLRTVKSFGAALGARDSMSPPRTRRMGLQSVDSFKIRAGFNPDDPQSMPSSPLRGLENFSAAYGSALGRRLSSVDSLEGSDSDREFFTRGLSSATMPKLETIESIGTSMGETSEHTNNVTLPQMEQPLRPINSRESLMSTSGDPFNMTKRSSITSMSGDARRSTARDSMTSLSGDPFKMSAKKDLHGSSGSFSTFSRQGSNNSIRSRSSSQDLLDDSSKTDNSTAKQRRSSCSDESLQIVAGRRGNAAFVHRATIVHSNINGGGGGVGVGVGGDEPRKLSGRRHSMGGNPATIAMRRRESSGSAGLGSLGSTGALGVFNSNNNTNNLKTTASVVSNPQNLLGRQSSNAGRRTSSVMEYCVASQRQQAWEMGDPSITMIDDYVHDGRYGIEVAERLFWEALVIRQENHCQKWHILHPKDKTHNNNNNDLYDPQAHSEDQNTTRPPKENFAQKLMNRMIEVGDEDPDNSVIEWIEDEKSWSFVIVDKDRFVNEVLWPIRRKDEEQNKNDKNKKPDAMFPTKYSSFAGELRRCRFVEETTGSGFARFSHCLFRKDRPEHCALIGSEHDTGRVSSSSLQDANFKALRYKPTNTGCAGGHRVVLFNMEDETDPLCPHNLLMAYEEHGRVVPVVSDFDGFLVGTKRINFDQELPPEQVEILEGSILSAQEILEGKAMGDNWMEKWLYASRDHLGQNNSRISGKKRPKMPQFGYGDAKSYRLMEGAVAQLAKVDGAVRHGSECFNYVFPQEIDQTFLVISDTLGGRVRWKYVDSVKLHYFLSNCIDDGFAFPLNPKWVLCDPGWSKLYDKLMQSKVPNVQKALKVWFPPKIREMINQIQTKHPTGLRFSTPGKGPKKGTMGLPCIAKYILRARKRNGVVPMEPEAADSVTLWIDRGSVILFSKPELRTGLVCATNESCVPICGGVTQALTGVGGPELLEDVKALPVLWESSFGPVRCVTGSAKIVSRKGGKNYGCLDVSHVIYAVGPAYGETYSSDNDVGIKDGLLRDAYRKSLQCAKDRGLEAVAFSLLSAGKRSSRWDPQRALRIAVRAIVDYEDYGSLKEIHMCAFTAGEVAALENIAKEFGLSSAPV